MTAFRRYGLATAGLAVALTLSAVPSRAEDAVWDPEEIARMAEQSARLAEGVSRAVELVEELDQLSLAVGHLGGLANLDVAAPGTTAGLAGSAPSLGGLAAGIVGPQPVVIASLGDAESFVGKLTAFPTVSTTARGQFGQAMAGLQRNAAEDGYALAVQGRQSVSQAPQRARSLVAGASSAVDLRADLGADTTAGLAVLEQLTSLKAMLAALVEIEATRQLGRYAPGSADTPMTGQ